MNLLSAGTTNNIRQAFAKEADAKEAEVLKNGRSAIRRRVNERRKKKLTPKNGWTATPRTRRRRFRSRRQVRRWINK